MYNGDGTMIHCSGFIYEGSWINGKPAKMAVKLAIVGEPVLELTQGQTFTIEIECRTEDDEKIEGINWLECVYIHFAYFKRACFNMNVRSQMNDINKYCKTGKFRVQDIFANFARG